MGKQSSIENWVLEDAHAGGEINDEDDAIRMMTKIRYILKRLIEVDHILLIHQTAAEVENRILEVHPNYEPQGATQVMEDPDEARMKKVQAQAKMTSKRKKREERRNRRAKKKLDKDSPEDLPAEV